MEMNPRRQEFFDEGRNRRMPRRRKPKSIIRIIEYTGKYKISYARPLARNGSMTPYKNQQTLEKSRIYLTGILAEDVPPSGNPNCRKVTYPLTCRIGGTPKWLISLGH